MVLKIRSKVKGSHTWCALFMGPEDGNLAHIGDLTFTHREFAAYADTLQLGSLGGPLEVLFEVSK